MLCLDSSIAVENYHGSVHYGHKGRPDWLRELLHSCVGFVPCRFIYLFIAVGAIVFLVSLFGCIGAGTRNTCCLCFVSFLMRSQF